MQVDFRATSGVAASTTSGGLFSAVDLAATASNFDQFSSQLPEMSCAEAEARICSNLKYIMQSVDLDAVTSRDIRERLEQRLAQPLGAYKEFIDRNMLVILGQLDKPSRIFDYLYLGTEWNASNWEELKSNRYACNCCFHHVLNFLFFTFFSVFRRKNQSEKFKHF